jgi:hypothetical protein
LCALGLGLFRSAGAHPVIVFCTVATFDQFLNSVQESCQPAACVEAVSKPPLGPNLCVGHSVQILEIQSVFLRFKPRGRLDLEPD